MPWEIRPANEDPESGCFVHELFVLKWVIQETPQASILPACIKSGLFDTGQWILWLVPTQNHGSLQKLKPFGVILPSPVLDANISCRYPVSQSGSGILHAVQFLHLGLGSLLPIQNQPMRTRAQGH